MDIVEVPSSSLDLGGTSPLLVRHDDLVRHSVVRLIAEKTLSRCQRRRVLAEELHIGGDTNVRATVLDDVASVVAHSLNLK